MQKAKQAVTNFMSGDGHHKTTVSEDVNAAVTEERVMPQRHENVTTAIDREVHQDHHMTTVQPITQREVLPEKHSHNMMPVQEKTFNHGNESDIRSKIELEAAKFKNTSVTHDTTHTSTVAPTVSGERVHHHVHEHIQPVIQKEVIAPQVVHTTVPVHEVHHATAQHHGTKVLPTKTLEEFKSGGGILGHKSETRVGEYDGCPDSTTTGKDMHTHSHDTKHAHGSRATNAGPHNSNLANKLDPRVDSDLDGKGPRSGTGMSGSSGMSDTAGVGTGTRHQGTTSGTGILKSSLRKQDDSTAYTTTSGGQTGSSMLDAKSVPRGAQTTTGHHTATNTTHSHTNEGHKTSLLDKLNPFTETGSK